MSNWRWTMLAVVAVAVMGAGVAVGAQAPAGRAGTAGRGGPGAGPGRGGAAGMPSNLRAAMNEMQTLLLALKAEAPDKAKKDQALKDVAQLERDAAISKTISPPWVLSLPDDKKAEEAANYRKMMTALMKELINLEEAIDSEKADDLKKSFANIEDLMKQGHMEFAP